MNHWLPACPGTTANHSESIATLHAHRESGYLTYQVANPYDDGIGLDEYVDWITDAGYEIERIGHYGDWLQRFEKT